MGLFGGKNCHNKVFWYTKKSSGFTKKSFLEKEKKTRVKEKLLKKKKKALSAKRHFSYGFLLYLYKQKLSCLF